jgi:hypothetical protein
MKVLPSVPLPSPLPNTNCMQIHFSADGIPVQYPAARRPEGGPSVMYTRASQLPSPIRLTVITWHQMASHGITWHHMASHGITWHHMASHGITWPHKASHRITWHHMASHRITWHHIASHGITWHHMASHGITWHHMASHGITGHHMASHGITWHRGSGSRGRSGGGPAGPQARKAAQPTCNNV